MLSTLFYSLSSCWCKFGALKGSPSDNNRSAFGADFWWKDAFQTFVNVVAGLEVFDNECRVFQ